MELQKAKDWVDLVLKAMSIAAIIAAGVWAIYQFNLFDTAETNAELTISTETLPYSGNNKLLLIHVHPKNIGKVPISPQHLTVTVRDLPSDLKPGAIDLEKLKDRYKVDILDRYKDGYDMEPGVVYDEIVAMVVPNDTMYSVYGEIDLDPENEVDQTAVVRIK